MKSYRFLISLLTLALSIGTAAAEKRPITAHDLFAIKRLGSPVLAPDGKSAVFTVQEWSVETSKSTSNLWLVDTAGGDTRRLTVAQASDSAPAWSPDGKRIAFVSKRGKDNAAALHIIPVDGGEAEKILELPFNIISPKWLPDGQHVIIATNVIAKMAGDFSKDNLEAMNKEVKRRKDAKMTAKVTEDRQYRIFDTYLTDNLASRLLRVNVATKKITDLTPGYDRWFQIFWDVDFDIAADGSQVVMAMNSTRPPYRDFLNCDVFLIATDGSGTLRNLTTDNAGDDRSAAFSPDGKSVYYLRTETPYYCGESDRLWRHDLATGQNTPLTEALDHSIGSFKISPDGKTLWLIAEEKGAVPVFRLKPDGTGLAAVYKEGSSSGLTAGPDTVVFLNSNMSRPDELFAFDRASGTVRQLTHCNDDLLAQFELGKKEEFWFDGAAGDRVHGWLVYPPGYGSAKTYPLVHVMHGGPHAMASDSWHYRWNAQAFAAPGYVVVQVNRHGSTGFGEKFAGSVLKEWGDKPFDDIMKATDHLLETLPNLDSKRVAATGASYGGYLATWILGHTDRFACIVNHAGANNFYSEFAADCTHGLDEIMGGTPWQNVEGMQRNNPMFYAKNFKTPTLITHGELDYRVPYGQGLELYGVLQSMSVPSRLVVYPNENHWILSPQNSIRWYWEYHDWLARHLAMPRSDPPAFEIGKEK